MPARSLHLPSLLLRRALKARLPSALVAKPGLAQDQRPAYWAQPVQPAPQGLPNLHLVAPGLYRSAQPTAAGFAAARAMGIVTVISLRQTVRDAPLARGTGLELIRIRMKARHVAEKDGAKILAALGALRAARARGPVLIHCHHGADRTGVICALWRLVEQGWSRAQAIDELTLGGFGYHPIWANIPDYLARVDLNDLRARLDAKDPE